MKKSLCILAVLLIAISPVLAFTSEVTIVTEDEITGAILKVKNPATQEYGDKIYPNFTASQMSVGLVVFNVETSLAEAGVSIILKKDGEVIFNSDKGPYTMSGDIVIDLRENHTIASEEVLESPVETETATESNESIVETTETPEEEIAEEKTDNLTQGINVTTEELDSWFTGLVTKVKGLTGFSVSGDSDSSSRGTLFFVFGGILMAGIVLFLVIRGAYLSGAKAARKVIAYQELDSKLDTLN